MEKKDNQEKREKIEPRSTKTVVKHEDGGNYKQVLPGRSYVRREEMKKKEK